MKKLLQVGFVLIIFIVFAFGSALSLESAKVEAITENEVSCPVSEIECYKSGTKHQAPPVAFNGTNWDKWMSLCMCRYCCEK